MNKDYKVEIYASKHLDFTLLDIKETSDTKEIAEYFNELSNSARLEIYHDGEEILTAYKKEIKINATDYDGSKYLADGSGIVFESFNKEELKENHKELLADLSKMAFDLEEARPNYYHVLGDKYDLNRDFLKELSEQSEVKQMENVSSKIEESFLEDYSSNQKLNEAVIAKMGGFESFAENAKDISEHGIDAGFGGFIYHSDTVSFAQENRDIILDALKEDAQEFGHESVPEMMSNWKVLDGWSQDEIAEALYSNDENLEAHTTVYNALAWYAGEKASQEYTNAIDSLESENSLDTTFDKVQDLVNSGHEISADKVELLNHLDQYLEQNDLSVSSITIGDQAIDFGEIEIEITNMKKINGEFQDDVTVQIDDKGIWVSGLEDTFSKTGDANLDFTEIKNALDKELGNEITISHLHENNQLTQVSTYETKANAYESNDMVDHFLKNNGTIEKTLDVNGERVAWKSGNDLIVDFSGENGSEKAKVAEALESKGTDLGANVLSLDDVQGFSSKIDSIADQKQEVKPKDNGMELD